MISTNFCHLCSLLYIYFSSLIDHLWSTCLIWADNIAKIQCLFHTSSYIFVFNRRDCWLTEIFVAYWFSYSWNPLFNWFVVVYHSLCLFLILSPYSCFYWVLVDVQGSGIPLFIINYNSSFHHHLIIFPYSTFHAWSTSEWFIRWYNLDLIRTYIL